MRAETFSPEKVTLPTVGAARSRSSQRRRAFADLMSHTAWHINTNYLPMRCHYRLYDRSGRVIFSSRRVVLGDQLPEIDFVCRSYARSLSLCASVVYCPWSLRVDVGRLVPRRLIHRAVRAEVLVTPDCPRSDRPAEMVVRTIDLSPAEPQLLLRPSRRKSRQTCKYDRAARYIGLPLCQKNRKFAPDMASTDQNTDLRQIVASTIAGHRLLSPGDRVIVALSGGADSVALLSVMTELGYDCVAAHCNFHLRGDESQRDMRHAEAVCRELGVDLLVRDFDVDARRRLTGESVEMACRSLRYDWFDSLLNRERAKAIVVGHHREDSLETIMLNLLRGTGLDGLRGMRYRRDYIVRPMLDCSRAQIEEHLAARRLGFVNDSSNLSDAHLRNRLRNHIIPEILRYFPDAGRAILNSAANLNAAAAIYHKAIDGYRTRFVDDRARIDLARLLAEEGDTAPTILRELLKDVGITPSQCADIIASASASGLKFHGSSDAVVELDRGFLSVSRPELVSRPDSYPVDLRRDLLVPVNLCMSLHHVSEFNPGRDSDVIYLDAEALDSAHRWELRRWRKSDRIKPFGMTGSRLVSDLFSDAKFSASDKRNAWLLTCDGIIVWVVGLRASSLFAVTPLTKNYVEIKYKRSK